MVSLQKVHDLFVGFFCQIKIIMAIIISVGFMVSPSLARHGVHIAALRDIIQLQLLKLVPLAHGVSTEHKVMIQCVYVLLDNALLLFGLS